jgi:threonylcarbamoyladenosine tRNA methylthiotransferase MtaB
MAKISFQIYSLGCKVNQYDAAVLRRELEACGLVLAIRQAKPEVIIISTCTVTQKAITKDRQLITKLRREFPNSLLVITGCWPETDEKMKSKFKSEKIIIWGVGNTPKLVARIISFFSDIKISENKVLESRLIASFERSRYFIKVGDGCNQFCAYCLIPFARGRLTSRPSAELIKEITAATSAGYREIILSGIHLGQYGDDQKGKELNLVGLLKEILKIKNLGRVRLSSIEIKEVTPELIKLMKKEPKICRHLHISLQSGTDKILKLMKRPYTTAYFIKRVNELRKALPEIAISTDIIVGFPGESKRDFQATFEFAQKINFSKIHVFSFSAHEKTAAFKLADRIAPAEIKQRSAKLRELSNKLEADYQKKILILYKNKPLSLVKEKGGGEKVRVKTEFGFDIYLNKKGLV